MSRAVATDAYSGKELAKTMAIIGAVNGIAPVTAPVIGGLVSAAVGWQGIFVILLGIGIVLTLMCTRFRESLPMERRNKSGLRSVYAAFFTVLRVRRYVLYLLSFGFANGVLFGYIASAPFVVQTHYGLSELGFSIFFALNSIFIGIGTGISLKFKNITNAGLCGAIGMVVFAVVQYVAFLTVDSFYCYVPAMSLTLLSMGILFTSTTSMAMDAGRVSVGAASAIFGALGFFMGGVVSPVVGIGNLMHSMSITLIASAALSLCCMVLARCIKSVE
jgi:DHA1 family bicyclomycin/chloramphenicol resistance-like MFS transporter